AWFGAGAVPLRSGWSLRRERCLNQARHPQLQGRPPLSGSVMPRGVGFAGFSNLSLFPMTSAAIYNYFKKQGITTEVMGASFRNIGQIQALAGCDLLTISPDLLAQLQATEAPLAKALDADAAKALDLPKVSFNEAAFRFALNQDAMATEKLAEGIRLFATDAGKLDQMIESLR
ncbi:hypothetical protein FKK32_29550, partial [Klebsiella pneumoniae]|nr:hypothetical protein [Klebsiella pneumoniae]